MNRIEHGADTTFVVSFWATWCGPCVAEMHYFEELDSAYRNTKTKVIMVSLDFQRDIQKKVVPFLAKRNLKMEVYVLDETNDNFWIPRVDGAWQGNIPATLIRNPLRKFRRFIPRETTFAEMDSLLLLSRQ